MLYLGKNSRMMWMGFVSLSFGLLFEFKTFEVISSQSHLAFLK